MNRTVKLIIVLIVLDVKQIFDYERAMLRGIKVESVALHLEVERKTAEVNKVQEMERKY